MHTFYNTQVMPQEVIILFVVLGVINLGSFVSMGVNKYLKKHHKWHMEDHTLLTMAVLFGGVGVLLGMLIFQTKLKKKVFTIIVPLLILAEAALLWYFLNEYLFGPVDISRLPAA